MKLRTCTWRADSPAPGLVAGEALGPSVSLLAMSQSFRPVRLRSGCSPSSKGHDIFLGDCIAGRATDLALDIPLPHDNHAVTDANDLGQFARNHDDTNSLPREFVDDPVDLGF